MGPLRTKLESLPTSPGAYLMKDARGRVLYVGKAVDLRARVKQYFGATTSGDGRFHVAFLIPRIHEVEVVVTTSEREALVLEDTLIKKYQPRYNVRLKDDKTWLSLRLDVQGRWPRPSLVRRWKDDGARYFGPYLNELRARDVLRLLKRTVPLRTCSDAVFRAHSSRPCIEHAIGRCAAPCVGLIEEDDYNELVDEAVLLLEGRNKPLVRSLKKRMASAAEQMRYEDAARVRDSIRILEELAQRKDTVDPSSRDRDVFGLHREGALAAVAVVPIREGRMQDARAFTFRNVAGEDGELLGRLITQLYSRTIRPPPEILVPCRVDDAELRAELLGELADRRVSIRTPQRGQGLRQLDVATRNARVRFDAAHSRAERNEQALFGLQKVLRLAELPRRIECYDNSNIQGQDPVGAMVTFQDGQPHKAGYRLFRIRGVEGADDYATMREVLGRRVERARSDPEGWGLPDLVVIDGGRGQLAMAVEACREAGVDVVSLDGRAIEPSVGGPLLRVIALAKPRADEETDKVYEPGRSNPISLRRRDPALQLLQAARDEAHRFGVSQHRKQRKKRTLRSDLDEVPGIGPTLRKRLLRHFGSMKQLRAASADELEAVSGVGRAKAKAISAALAAAKKGGLS